MSAAVEEPTNLALTAAVAFRDRGWRPFPVDHPALAQCASAHKSDGGICDRPAERGKHPVGHWPTMTASTQTDATLALWFGDAARNVGIAVKPSGLLVLDEDELGALEALAEQLGEEIPETYRVRTGRGWHWYFAAPDDETIGNRTGALRDHHIDVRGNKGDGGYVVAAGSTHHTGVEYIAEDPWAHPAELPEWIREQIRAAPAEQPGATGGTREGRWDDEPRYGYTAELFGQYQRHLDAVSSPGFRFALFLAALDGWRLVNAGLLARAEMLGQLKDVIVRVWGAEPDRRDDTIVFVEALEKAKASPWIAIDRPAQLGTGSGGLETIPYLGGDPGEQGGGPEVDPPSAWELEVLHELRKLDIREEAKRRRAQRDARERPSILDGLIDSNDLDDLPDPKMLLGEFIPEAAVGLLAGKFGSYKSFVTVSWACSLASGQAWLGRAEFAVPEPVKVLYVAAEGASGMKLRRRAWCSKFGGVERGQLLFYDKAVNLTDPAAVEDLAAAVVAKGFKVVFIDTLHRSAPGAEENSSTELGMVFEAACKLRDDHGVTVVFVDHTGHGGERPRGSSIKVDDSDFVIIADRPGEAATSDIQRTLKMHKRKDMDTDGEWPIRLQLVEGTGSGYVELGAVGAVDGAGVFGVEEEWHSLAAPEVPEMVAEKIATAASLAKGKGKKAALDIFRLLRHVGGERGMTQGEIQGALSEGPRVHHRSSVHAALGILSTTGIVGPGSTNERFLIDPEHL